MKLKISQKLIFLIEGILFFTVILSGIVTYFMSRNILIKRTDSQLLSVATLKENGVKEYLEDAKGRIYFFVSNKNKSGIILNILKVPSEIQKQTARKLLSEEITSDNRFFKEALIIDHQGLVVLSTNISNEGKIKSNESYFLKGIIGDNKPLLYYKQVENNTVIILTAPVKDENGKVIGILVGELGTAEISKIMLEKSGLGKTGETFLVNSSNLVITDLLKESGQALKKTIFLPQITICLEGKSNFAGKSDYHGDKVFGYWHWFPDLNSCLISKIDQEEIFASLYELLFILSGILITLAVVVGTLGYFVSRNITKPIIKLQETANKIKEGNFDDYVDIVSNDELGDMAMAFNKMTGKLKNYYQELEQQVILQTSQISESLSKANKQNQELEDNKKAMINLLEDSRILEEELEKEKRSVEKKVEEKTIQLSASISSLSIGLIMTDKTHNILLINRKARSIFELSKESIKNFDDFLNLFPKDSNIFKLHEDYHKEKVLMVKKGEVTFGSKILNVSFLPIIQNINENIAVLGMIILIDDITEAKLVQRSKDEFFSIASHELRTPLTAIRGNTDLINQYFSDQIKDPQLKEMINDIHESSIRLISIVNDFLETSRLEMKKIEFRKEKVDLVSLITKTIYEFQVTGSRKKLHLEFIKPTQEIPEIFNDGFRFKQVLINLIGNGLKYTEEGGVKVFLTKENGLVKISVVDTGRGITPEGKKLLFRKFQQTEDNIFTRDTTKSTGLGLYINRKNSSKLCFGVKNL